MDRIKGIGQEILGLFVEDARFSAALAIWIAISWATRPWWQSAPRFSAIALFAGFALILCENVLHAARRR
jgi:Ni/Fe-hydrogenase subunit HybB-like protein